MNYAYYHYADADNQPTGPLSADQLHALVQSGTIPPDTQVWKEGASEWHPYHSLFPPPTVRRPATPPPKMGTSSSQSQNPWYKRTGWSIVLFYFFSPIMFPLMWYWKLYTLRTRVYVSVAFAGFFLLCVGVNISDELSRKWEADRLEAQRISAEAAVRQEFQDKRGKF